MLTRTVFTLAVMTATLTLVIAGCEPAATEAPQPAPAKAGPVVQKPEPVTEKAPVAPRANLALQFEPGGQEKFRLVFSNERGYRFEQPARDEVTDERNKHNLEMVYTRRVQSVDAEGEATAEITIEQLKYFAQTKNKVDLDFDSTRPADKNDPLAQIIGRSYTIKIAPDGDVKSADLQNVYAAVKNTQAEALVDAVFYAERVMEFHTIPALPEDDASIAVGETWTKLKAGPAGMIEPRCYQKVYELDSVSDQDGARVAVVELQAAPTAENCPDMPEDSQSMGIFAKMFDSTDKYTGKLVFNLDENDIEQFQEKMYVEWVAAETPPGKAGEKGPNVLTMSFTKLHITESLDD